MGNKKLIDRRTRSTTVEKEFEKGIKEMLGRKTYTEAISYLKNQLAIKIEIPDYKLALQRVAREYVNAKYGGGRPNYNDLEKRVREYKNLGMRDDALILRERLEKTLVTAVR